MNHSTFPPLNNKMSIFVSGWLSHERNIVKNMQNLWTNKQEQRNGELCVIGVLHRYVANFTTCCTSSDLGASHASCNIKKFVTINSICITSVFCLQHAASYPSFWSHVESWLLIIHILQRNTIRQTFKHARSRWSAD